MKTVKKFTRVNAKTVEEAVSALRAANAWALAGGTDLVGTMRFEILPDTMYPQILVNLKTITPSLDYIKEEKGMLQDRRPDQAGGHSEEQCRQKQMGGAVGGSP